MNKAEQLFTLINQTGEAFTPQHKAWLICRVDERKPARTRGFAIVPQWEDLKPEECKRDAEFTLAALNEMERLLALNEKLAAALQAGKAYAENVAEEYGCWDTAQMQADLQLFDTLLAELQQPSPLAPAAGDGDSTEAAVTNTVLAES